MKSTLAVALTLILAFLPSARARAATGEIGLDAAALRLEGETESALRLRGSVNLVDDLDLEAQVTRTLGSDATLTSVLIGPSLRLPIDWAGDDAFPAWTLAVLVGGARAEAGGQEDDGFAWQGGVGVKWELGQGTRLRVEAGWHGLEGGLDAEGPFLAAGVAFRVGD